MRNKCKAAETYPKKNYEGKEKILKKLKLGTMIKLKLCTYIFLIKKRRGENKDNFHFMSRHLRLCEGFINYIWRKPTIQT